jgi:hypothetical protein
MIAFSSRHCPTRRVATTWPSRAAFTMCATEHTYRSKRFIAEKLLEYWLHAGAPGATSGSGWQRSGVMSSIGRSLAGGRFFCAADRSRGVNRRSSLATGGKQLFITGSLAVGKW